MAIIKKTDIREDGKYLEGLTAEFEKFLALEKVFIKQNKELADSLNLVKKSSDGAEAKKLVTVTEKLKTSTTELTNVQKERLKVKKQLDTAITKSIVANGKNAKKLTEVKIKAQEAAKAQKQLAKESLGLVDAYAKLSKRTNDAQKKFKNLAAQFGTTSKQAQKARIEFDKLDNKLRTVNNAAKDGRRDVGRYGTALKGVGSKLLGAAGIVGGIDLLVQGFQKFAETAKQVNAITRKVKTNFDVTNKEAKKLAVNINAIASTFDEDYNEVVTAANAVSKELGISASAALGLIEDGFLKGSNNSGEFLDILKEYPVQMAKSGISAEEFFAIINQQVTAGVYSDKGIDAIKEGGISLQENTKAVKAALKPLGETVQLEIERLAATGNTFEAMQLLTQSMEDGNLTAMETQAIMSDVFRGAGEDAESFVMNLHNLESSLDDVNVVADETNSSTLELSKSWNKFVASISDSDSIFSKAWNGIKRGLSSVLSEVGNQFERMTTLFSEGFGAAQAVMNRQNGIVANSLSGLSTEITTTKKSTDELIASTKNYINESGNLVNSDGKVIKTKAQLSREIEKQARALEKEQRKLEKLRKAQEDYEKFLAKQEEGRLARNKKAGGPVAAIGTAEDLNGQFDDFEDYLAKRAKALNDSKIEEAEINAAHREAEKEIGEAILEESFNFANDLFAQSQANKVAAAEAAAEAEKKILQDQLDKGFITEAEFAAKSVAIDKKVQLESAKAGKRTALFNIAMNTAAAIVKALGSAPPPLNFVNAGLVAALGAVQAAFVAARPLPGFAKGEVNIKGRRHSQGGVNAEIEGGESVINRNGTANAPLTLEAINRGLLTDRGVVDGMTKNQTDNLLASLLMAGNKQNADILTVVSNLGYAYPFSKDVIVEKTGSGEIKKHIIS